MIKLKRKLKTPKGFMIIIAMIMFAIMSYWSIAAMKRSIQTITNTKNTNLYYRATAIADSMMEDLQYIVKKEHDSGYNLNLECNYGKYKVGKPANDPRCAEHLAGGFIKDEATDNVKVKLTIKGRSNDELGKKEQFKSCNIGDLGDCYVVPFPGTGDASEQCKGYKPDFNGDNARADKPIDGNGGFVNDMGEECPKGEGIDCIKQIDYACNWNKLQFGSNLLDRAVIPFYYDDGEKIFNPFKDKQNSNFVLRVRTPCKRCDERLNKDNCNSDPTICSDPTIITANTSVVSDRYVLDDTKNDTIVQWQLTGQCPPGSQDEECGLIQYRPADLSTPLGITESSAITESRINGKDYPTVEWANVHIVLTGQESRGFNINTYDIDNRPFVYSVLQLWTKPILSLFLGEKLKAGEHEFVPYLEYQLLTDTPVANPRMKLEAFVSVDGIGARKTMYKEERKQLIDFAIQN